MCVCDESEMHKDEYILRCCSFILYTSITWILQCWLQNEDRLLWKLGTLPPGLMTFYGLTYSLNKSWHVLGLGYNPSINPLEIENAAVIHYNGNMKPWLEMAMTKYRPYWTKYIDYDHPYLRQCNFIKWNWLWIIASTGLSNSHTHFLPPRWICFTCFTTAWHGAGDISHHR